MRSRLVIKDGKSEWVKLEAENTYKQDNRKLPACGEDLSIDSYINKYGGIKSIIDDSVHITKASYMDHLKRNNKTIKDW